jgi:hypothetical protein
MIAQDIEQQEEIGATLFALGQPADVCRTRAALRGWELAEQRHNEAEAKDERAWWWDMFGLKVDEEVGA